jgi:integrase/recombinase XerD
MNDLDGWVLWMKAAGHSPATIRTRTQGIRALCSHAQVQRADQITETHVEAWLSDCSKGWTQVTYWRTVKAWAGWAVAHGLIAQSPLANMTKPRTPRSLPRPVPDAVIRALLNGSDPAGSRVAGSISHGGATTVSRTRAYVALAALAGLRVHEIAKIRGEDVDLSSGWMFVEGKGGRRAALPLHPVLVKIAAGMPPTGYWFGGRDNGHVSGAHVGYCIRQALRDIGSTATAHQLRHSFGTAVLRSTHDLRVTQELLRHASPASTAIYTQVADLDKIAAVNSLGWVA